MVLAVRLCAAPVDDLASPDQATRVAAAKIVRASWKEPRAKWEPLVASIKRDMTRLEFDQLVAPLKRKGTGWGKEGMVGDTCQLDDTWILGLTFREQSAKNHQQIPGDNPDDTLL